MHDFEVILGDGADIHFVTDTHFSDVCLDKIRKIRRQCFDTKFAIHNTQSTSVTNTTRITG